MSTGSGLDVATLPPINVNDSQTIKHTLDEQAIAYVKAKGYQEDRVPVVLSFVISVIAVSLAVYGHFLPYPSERAKIIVCVLGFWCCSFFLKGLKFAYGQNSLICTKERESQNPAQIQKLGNVIPGFILSTTMELRQDIYKVILTPRKCELASSQLQECTKDLSVFEFFDVSGNFLRTKFYDRLGEAFDTYQTTAVKKQQ